MTCSHRRTTPFIALFSNESNRERLIVRFETMKRLRYLISYFCLDCRKVFKRQCVPGNTAFKCPHCSGIANNVGRKFKAPRRTNEEQWKKVELLLASGFRFNTIYEKGVAIRYPETLKDAETFVREHRPTTIIRSKANKTLQRTRANR
jgi:hypothetical protein